jgi:hypothetical protein
MNNAMELLESRLQDLSNGILGAQIGVFLFFQPSF